MGSAFRDCLLLILPQSAVAESGQEPIKSLSISCKVPYALSYWQDQTVSTFML